MHLCVFDVLAENAKTILKCWLFVCIGKTLNFWTLCNFVAGSVL